MTIDEAIEELTDLSKVGLNRLTPSELRALKLGVEALKRLEKERAYDETTVFELLPGETI